MHEYISTYINVCVYYGYATDAISLWGLYFLNVHTENTDFYMNFLTQSLVLPRKVQWFLENLTPIPGNCSFPFVAFVHVKM